MDFNDAVTQLDGLASEIEKQDPVIALAIDHVSDNLEKLSKYEIKTPIRSINDFYIRCKDNEPLATFAYDFAAEHGYSKIPLDQRAKAVELNNLWKWYDHDMAGFDNEDDLVEALNKSAKVYKFPNGYTAAIEDALIQYKLALHSKSHVVAKQFINAGNNRLAWLLKCGPK